MNALDYKQQPGNLVIIGASGDLTKRKLIPAFFSLYCNGMLPDDFRVVGFARSPLSDAEFRDLMVTNLTCRYVPGDRECAEKMDGFLSRCFYCSGQYGDPESFRALRARLTELGGGVGNTLTYMAIPPSIFTKTAESLGAAGMLAPLAPGRWSRVVLEKPFGRDSESSRELHRALSRVMTPEQTYRIDHYLGKEVIQNLLILRFANLVFDPVWNRQHIQSVCITFSEKIGCEGRAGYFDHYGIIRDVMQNHLVQILALVAMEQPVRLDARAIADEKVKLLRSVKTLALEDVVVGQYVAGEVGGEAMPGYLDDPEVPRDSLTPTYAHATFSIPNRRWFGVPFYVSAGKALHTNATEICIQFRDEEYSIFNHLPGMRNNRMVIRVQPNEAISLELVNKVPGLELALSGAKLDLLYHAAYKDTTIPEAYERLLLDVLRGDQSLFLQDEELAESWRLVTPVLQALEAQRVKPLPYPFGSRGPMRGSSCGSPHCPRRRS